MTKGPCSRCGKRIHATYEDAKAAIRGLRAGGKFVEDMVVYRCGDHFHIGRNPAKLRRRIRKALRGSE